jgi:pectin methylesterase-like acyl-CoA thioesterase
MLRRSRSAALATLVAAIGLLALALPAAGAPAAQFFVDGDGMAGPGCVGSNTTNVFTTIQGAVDAVTLDNTRIYVCPGTYEGQVHINDEDGTSVRSIRGQRHWCRPLATSTPTR